jgi:hypothetical protein
LDRARLTCRFSGCGAGQPRHRDLQKSRLNVEHLVVFLAV